MKNAIVTGVTGQDGAYLARRLLDRGYKVYGTFRRSSSVNNWRLEELGVLDHPNLSLTEFDLLDQSAAYRLIERAKPEHVYNLAAQSFVGVSFDQPIATAQMTAIGPLQLLEAIRVVNPKVRFYQASSSEMFGLVQETPQTEKTPFHPRSPYAVAKVFAHWATVNYREAYDIFAASGILFNHESPLRGQEFVTRKITNTAARISLGLQDVLELGNLDAQRDWGYADEYVEGMIRMLEAPKPDTYVLATNVTCSVRKFVSLAFKAVDIDLDFTGKGEEETGVCRKTGKTLVRVNPKFYRPAEVEFLLGDYSKAKTELDWSPQTDVPELCRLMVEADLRRNRARASF